MDTLPPTQAHNLRSRVTSILAITMCMATVGAIPASAETVSAEPDAFLEYVETNQDANDSAKVTQYIDTGVKAETGLKARLDAVILSSTRNDSAILGARYNSDRRFLMLHNNSSFSNSKS